MKKLLLSLPIFFFYLHLQAQNWSLTGNSGTSPGTDFIGTKDAKALVFKVNKQWSGYIDYSDSKANTSFGFQAAKNNAGLENSAFGYKAFSLNNLGGHNLAAGAYALYNNTNGSSNTAVGDETLYNNQIGWENTALGQGALFSNTGYYNTASGYSALRANTGGESNSAYGISALVLNTTGSYNTALGANAITYNTTGISNTAAGTNALYHNTGSYNTGVGQSALAQTTGAYYNTAIGFAAGDSYDNGFNNVFIGANTDVNGAGYYNVVVIGQAALATASNQVTIGNPATNSYRAYANWSNISDGRVKQNIKQNVPGLSFINKLQPITYNLDLNAADKIIQSVRKDSTGKIIAYNNIEQAARQEKEKIVYTGFVAQDVEKAAKSVSYNFSGVDAAKNDKDVYGLRYAEFVVPLVKAVQELSKQNDSLQKQNNDLEARLARLENMIKVPSLSTAVHLSSATLSQNTPNPVNNSTNITYTLPSSFSIAKIVVTSKTGVVLKQINLSENKGSINVDAANLSSGTYQYTLYVDGKMIDSKQMLIAK